VIKRRMVSPSEKANNKKTISLRQLLLERRTFRLGLQQRKKMSVKFNYQCRLLEDHNNRRMMATS
jgi:hypothetical protein